MGGLRPSNMAVSEYIPEMMFIREQKNFHNVLVFLRLIIVQRFTMHIVSGLSVNYVQKMTEGGQFSHSIGSVWKFIHVFATLQDIVNGTMLGGKNSVEVSLLFKLLFVGLKTMSPSATAKDPAHYSIHCVPFKVSNNVLVSLFNQVIL